MNRSRRRPASLRLLGVLCALCATSASGARAQAAARASEPCGDAAERQFDFWVGDWDVRQEFPQPDGTVIRLPARSTVTREAQGCALLERWRGRVQYFWEGMTAPDSLHAISVRAWDEVDGVWRIHWMDTRAPRRWVDGGSTGGFENGVGVFLGPPNEQGYSSNRIRFFDIGQDTVEWELATRASADAPWFVIWRMHFERRR